MITTIGIMIGAYTFVRMISFATRKGERKESAAVQVLAVLASVLIVLCTLSIILTSASSPQMPSLN